MQRRPFEDEDWQDVAENWEIRGDTIYLNHGSFGPPPRPVRLAQLGWLRQLQEQPADFYVRRLETALGLAKQRLAGFVGTDAANLVFQENATAGINVVASSFPLHAQDEVLLTDHEYGAVHRIWERACARASARLVVAELPEQLETHQAVVDAITARLTDRTRLIVVSHITSPTALILPIAAIISAARLANVAVCVDGPHAPAQLPLAIDRLDCDFYAASCHKWLSAPLGTGFLYVHPRWQSRIKPQVVSWGRLPPGQPETWSDEFIWSGTRDPSGYLSVPAAIEFLETVGPSQFRERTSYLAHRCESILGEVTGERPLASGDGWYGCMAHMPLPRKFGPDIKARLWEGYGIEALVLPYRDRWCLRISCHLYTMTSHLERLGIALRAVWD